VEVIGAFHTVAMDGAEGVLVGFEKIERDAACKYDCESCFDSWASA
jgi:hypothetical protein